MPEASRSQRYSATKFWKLPGPFAQSFCPISGKLAAWVMIARIRAYRLGVGVRLFQEQKPGRFPQKIIWWPVKIDGVKRAFAEKLARVLHDVDERRDLVFKIAVMRLESLVSVVTASIEFNP